MESIRIEHAQTATILVISNAGEHILQENLIAVTLVDEYVLSRADQLSQIFDLFWRDVDEMELTELRLDRQRVKWTSGNKFLCCFRKMLSGSRKSVDIDVEEGEAFVCAERMVE